MSYHKVLSRVRLTAYGSQLMRLPQQEGTVLEITYPARRDREALLAIAGPYLFCYAVKFDDADTIYNVSHRQLESVDAPQIEGYPAGGPGSYLSDPDVPDGPTAPVTEEVVLYEWTEEAIMCLCERHTRALTSG